MSELKATTVYDAYWKANSVGKGTGVLVYPKSEADKVIVGLKDKLQNVSELLKETREWLIESQKMHQRCADNASKQIRRLKRALYKACANWADVEVFERTIGIDDPNVEANRWALMRNKCLKKVEEYR